MPSKMRIARSTAQGYVVKSTTNLQVAVGFVGLSALASIGHVQLEWCTLRLEAAACNFANLVRDSNYRTD